VLEVLVDFLRGFLKGAVEAKPFRVRRADAVVGAIPFRQRIEDLRGALNDFDVGFRNGRSGVRVVGLRMEAANRMVARKQRTNLARSVSKI
jgi:hypothetical protein